MRPAGVKEEWDENDMWMQAQLLAYQQIRTVEENRLEDIRLHAILKVPFDPLS